MELAKWLVRRAPELVWRVRRSARSSSMMHILHSSKTQAAIIMWLKKKLLKLELAEWLAHLAAKLVSRGSLPNQVISHDACTFLI